MTKDEQIDNLKNKISMALKDPFLQIGFEIICKNLSELENSNSGLKAGKDIHTPTKWHDLRENPDDLPKEMENVIIYASDYGINTCYVAHRLYDKWWSNCSSERFIHVLAWCELPTFKE